MERRKGVLLLLDDVRRTVEQRGDDSLGIDDGSSPEPFWVGPIDPRFRLAYSVRINGQPHGKGSVRVVEFENKKTGERRRRGIQAPKSRKYEDMFAFLAQYQRPRTGFELPLDGPLVLRVLTVQRRPKNIPKKLRLPVDPTDPLGRMFAPVQPDWDNLGKSTGDGLKKGGAIAEDGRIVDGRVVTLYGRVGESPFLEAYLWALDPTRC